MENPATTSPVEQVSALSPEEQNNNEILRAKHDRKVIVDALENGTLCCLPDANGNVDTTRAKNPVTRTNYRGSTLLLLKQFAKNNNFPTADYVTFEGVSFMNEKLNLRGNDRIMVEKGSKGITITYSNSVKDASGNDVLDENGKKTYEIEHARLFNVAQLKNAEKVHDFEVIAKHERQEYIKSQLEAEGKNFNPKASEKSSEVITCNSSDPAEYLGQYFAAVSKGAEFKVSPEIAEAFKKNTKDFLFSANSAGHINPFNLDILSKKANAACVNYLNRNNSAEKTKETPSPRPKAPTQSHSMSDDDMMVF